MNDGAEGADSWPLWVLPRAASSSWGREMGKVCRALFPALEKKKPGSPIRFILAIVTAITVDPKMKDSEPVSRCSLK